MSSHEGKDRDKQRDGMVRRGFRSLSFRHSKKKKPSTGDCVDGRHSRHRHSASELTNNNNSASNASPTRSGIALFPFTAILRCDLSFKAGDRIDILLQTENCYDWWEGRLNGRTGIFPANYIKIVR